MRKKSTITFLVLTGAIVLLLGQVPGCPPKDGTNTNDSGIMEQTAEASKPIIVGLDCVGKDFVDEVYYEEYLNQGDPIPVVEFEGEEYQVNPELDDVKPPFDNFDPVYRAIIENRIRTHSYDFIQIDPMRWPLEGPDLSDIVFDLAAAGFDREIPAVNVNTGEEVYLNKDGATTGGKIGRLKGFIVKDEQTKIPTTIYFTNPPPNDFHIDGVDINPMVLDTQTSYFTFFTAEDCLLTSTGEVIKME